MAHNTKRTAGSGRAKRTPQAGRRAPVVEGSAGLLGFPEAGDMSDNDWKQFFGIVGGLNRDAESVGQLQAWHQMRLQANARQETDNLMRFFNIYRL
jgi:hypothetical protein